MSGTDDLVAAAQPYLATETIDAVAGMSWEWWYDGIVDDADVAVVWTSCTGTANLYGATGTLLLACTLTFPAAGQIKVTATPAQTLALIAPGGENINALHEVEVTTATSRKFLVVGARGGKFNIRAQAG